MYIIYLGILLICGAYKNIVMLLHTTSLLVY